MKLALALPKNFALLLDLSETKHNGRHLQLGAIPHKYNLTPVSVGMRHSDFNALMKGKVRERFANPYFTCAQIAMATVLGDIIGPQEEISFIFDRQEGRRAEAMQTLRQIVFNIAKLDSSSQRY
jgi:hypothetical protein